MGLTQDDFEIFEDDEPISQTEADRGILPIKIGFIMKTVLLLDLSGSIVSTTGIPKLIEATELLIDTLPEIQETAIYLFDGRAELQKIAKFSSDKSYLKS